MSTVCRKCGGAILKDAAEGLCAPCLLEAGLEPFAEPIGRGDEPTRADSESLAGTTGSAQSKATNVTAGPPLNLGDYDLLEEIGRGGQGVVYRARQRSLNRIVAVKVVRTGHWASPAHLKRFRLEAETAANLDNPNIVPIYEVGEHEGSCYFSMKFIEGGPLDELFKGKPMAIRPAAELIAKLSRAVHYAHERGILHRDIKPGNILLDRTGEPQLTDFGLARLTETESTMTRTIETLGTPSYMAPEQALGNPAGTGLTSPTDIYGLGAVLYHLLTGHPPFAGGTTYDTIRLLLETEPRSPHFWNPKIDRDLTTICLKCLEKDQQRRYPSALALAEDLERWLKHEPIRARHIGVLGRGRKWVRRNPTAAGLIASLMALAAVIGWSVWKSDVLTPTAVTGIAVLPFENLSHDREDAFFADGIQDDLLTKLAKIRALKVISRTSVMQYPPRSTGRDMHQIGNALRVSHVLAGSVRKRGSWVHINAQLIDTRTDTHVWVEQYDCDLQDVFTIQSDIAQIVAEQLQVEISPAERVAVQRPPTADLTAFQLYSRAKGVLLATNFTTGAQPNFLEAINLLNQAVADDPAFFQAYCQLASAHGQLYLYGIDRTPTRLALADAAVKAALRLRPDAGEAHLARAGNLYMGYLDYDGALTELATATKGLPNDPDLFELKGSILRRQGKQQEALVNLERAAELDPLNFSMLLQVALSYEYLRRYADEQIALNRALTIEPNDVQTKVVRAQVEYDWKANPAPLHQVLDEIRAKNPGDIENVADNWLICAMAERDPLGATEALAALGENKFGNDIAKFSRSFVEGLIARMTNEESKARAAFMAARSEQEKAVQLQPNYGPAVCVLGLIDAALGRKEEALQEGRRAVELLPTTKDALTGSGILYYFALIAAWAGEKDLACEQLTNAMNHCREISYGQLKLSPLWDPLRGYPCFEKMVASLAPK